MANQPPQPGGHAVEEAGRNCPYCRFPLKPGVPVLECPACRSVHHAECWTDNGGCAVLGCTAAPTSAPVKHVAQADPVEVLPVAATGSGRQGGSRAMVFAVVLLALAIAGGATAVALTAVNKGGGSGPRAPLRTAQKASAAPTHPAPATPRAQVGARPAKGSPFPGLPAGAADDIKQLLLSYYGAVANGDMSTAWSLLTPSYKSWKATTGGKSDWRRNEALNRRYLDPMGTQVSILRFDRGSGIATVMVTGMTYTKPGQGACDYKGVTWALLSSGRWLYDQGYVHDPARSAEWRPRKTETLGVPCESNGY